MNIKRIIAIVVLVVLLVGGKVATNIINNTAPDRYLLGEWEGVAVISNQKMQRITDGSLKMTIERDGRAVFDYGTGTDELEWECTSWLSDASAYGYELRIDNWFYEVYTESYDAFVLCQPNGDGVTATIFVEKGKVSKIDENTDYNELMDIHMEELGISYIEDEQALEHIQGDWRGKILYSGDETEYIMPGTVTITVEEDTYFVHMIDEDETGRIEFMGIANNMYLYDMMGEYEGIVLAYNETDMSLTMYEELTRMAVVFEKW